LNIDGQPPCGGERMNINDLKNMKRFKEIMAVLIKYGFEELVQRLEIPGTALIKKIHPINEDLGLHERIRLAMEALGPSFIKFGQIMSLRPDLLPFDLLEELSKLQDNVATLPPEQAQQAVEQYMGFPVRKVFRIFDAQPLAAASLSQVHRAVLHEGGHIVCVKIQRPGIQKQMQTDLDILESLATRLDAGFGDLKAYQLPRLVRGLRRSLLMETDFTIEAKNMRIARFNASATDIYIPQVYDEISNANVLVMEYVQGARYNSVTPDAAFDTQKLAKQGLEAAIKQILEDGFFHADPHPGNLLVTEDMNLCIIDWGQTGRITQTDRYALMDLLKAVVDKDSEAMVQTLLRLCETQTPVARPRAMERELLGILDAYYAVPIREMNIGQLLLSIFELIRHYQLRLPLELIMMIKALVTAEGSARQAYPDLNIIEETRALVSKLADKRMRPDQVWRNLRRSLVTVWYLQKEIPGRIGQIINKLDDGRLDFNFHLAKLEGLIFALESASNRLTTAIIAGAIIMGSSMIITTGVGPYFLGYPALGVIGYLISVILGLWLVVTILRSKNY
jgi:ubiquinone biosynthesis protein